MIKLGDIAKDNITGFKGVVVAITDWLHGCRRLTIQPTAMKDGKPLDTGTFDEQQCELLKSGAQLRTARTGGPRPEPSIKAQPSAR